MRYAYLLVFVALLVIVTAEITEIATPTSPRRRNSPTVVRYEGTGKGKTTIYVREAEGESKSIADEFEVADSAGEYTWDTDVPAGKYFFDAETALSGAFEVEEGGGDDEEDEEADDEEEEGGKGKGEDDEEPEDEEDTGDTEESDDSEDTGDESAEEGTGDEADEAGGSADGGSADGGSADGGSADGGSSDEPPEEPRSGIDDGGSGASLLVVATPFTIFVSLLAVAAAMVHLA